MKILSPNSNAPAPKIKRLLMVMMPTYFHPAWERRITGERVGHFDFYKLKFWQKVLVSKSFVHNTRSNPRSMPYMANLAEGFLKEYAAGAEADLLADRNVGDLPESFLQAHGNVLRVQAEAFQPWPADLTAEISERGYDAVLLLYADPVGLGWRKIEARLQKITPAEILVLNGRKRLFYLDPAARRKLLWRRFLERTWLVEIAAAAGLLLLAVPLTIYDLTFGKLLHSRGKA